MLAMYISGNHECVETLLFFMLQLYVSLYSIFNLMLWCYVWGLVRFWHKNTWLQLRKVFWLKISVLVATNYKLSMISKISSGFTHPNIKPVFTCSHWLGSLLACKSNTLWYIINNTQNTQKNATMVSMTHTNVNLRLNCSSCQHFILYFSGY